MLLAANMHIRIAAALVFEKAWVLSRVVRRKPTPLAEGSFPIDGQLAIKRILETEPLRVSG